MLTKTRLKNLKNNERVIDFIEGMKCMTEDIAIGLLASAMRKSVPQTRRMLYRWEDYGYLKISAENNRDFFKFTPTGLNLVELLKFSTGRLKWDKNWRILIFDVPENQRYKRDILRKKLSELNFYQLQKSVWITPYPLPNSFTKFLTELKVHRFLFSITTNKINREKNLKQIFNLK